jgi:hypothetical protein
MFFVYLNKDGLNKALKKCGGDPIKEYYQTSNQSPKYDYENKYAYLNTSEQAVSKFSMGETQKYSADSYGKAYNVLAMRRF